MTREHESEPHRLLAEYDGLLGTGGWVYKASPWGVLTAFDTAEGVLYRAELDNEGQLVGVSVTVPIDRLGARVNVAEAAMGLQGFRAPDEPAEGAVPSSAAVADMLAAGMGRMDIAGRYGRSVRTVDDWIAKARREHPERVPSVRRGRPRAVETSEPNQASGERGESPTTKGKNR